MNLDGIAAALCALSCVSLVALHVISSPSSRVWMNLPGFVRFGLFVTAGGFLFRAVVLVSNFASGSPPQIGPDGLFVLVGMTYTMTALAAYGLRRTYPARIWDRLKHIEMLARCGDRKGTAMVDLSLAGATVVAPGAEGWIEPGAAGDIVTAKPARIDRL